MEKNMAAATSEIAFKEKASFAMANFGNIPIMSVAGFLMIYYTDVIGLDPAAVATLFLITRIFDGINDPIMGFIIDHLPRTRLGRFRTYLLIGAVACSVNYVLLWFGPAWAPEGKLVIVYITYILLGLTFDLMDIPLNSMIPVMTADAKERASLSTIKGLFYMLGTLVFAVGAPLVIARLGQTLEAYYILVFTAVVVVLVFTTVGVIGIRERIEPINPEKYKLKDTFKMIWLRPILCTFIPTLIIGTSGAISGSSSIYFATYILDNRIEIMSISTIFSAIGMIPAVALSKLLVLKWGKKRLLTCAFVLGFTGPLLRLISVTSIPLLFTANVVTGFALGFGMVVLYNVQADNVDYVEYVHHRRAEGGIAALYSFVAKAGGGIGGAIAGYVLSATGYIANQAQTETAKLGIIVNVVVLPIALYVTAALVFGVGYNIGSDKLKEINETLDRRRAEKAGM